MYCRICDSYSTFKHNTNRLGERGWCITQVSEFKLTHEKERRERIKEVKREGERQRKEVKNEAEETVIQGFKR